MGDQLARHCSKCGHMYEPADPNEKLDACPNCVTNPLAVPASEVHADTCDMGEYCSCHVSERPPRLTLSPTMLALLASGVL